MKHVLLNAERVPLHERLTVFAVASTFSDIPLQLKEKLVGSNVTFIRSAGSDIPPEARHAFVERVLGSSRQVVMTTFCPLIVGCCTADQVRIVSEGRVSTPDFNTFGLSADQILRQVFGMRTTRNPEAEKVISEIRASAESGDFEAARKLHQVLAYGVEP